MEPPSPPIVSHMRKTERKKTRKGNEDAAGEAHGQQDESEKIMISRSTPKSQKIPCLTLEAQSDQPATLQRHIHVCLRVRSKGMKSGEVMLHSDHLLTYLQECALTYIRKTQKKKSTMILSPYHMQQETVLNGLVKETRDADQMVSKSQKKRITETNRDVLRRGQILMPTSIHIHASEACAARHAET